MVSRFNASARAMAQALHGKRYTAEELAVLSKPSFVNSHWRPPVLNARAIARLRKEAYLRGEELPLPEKPTRNDRLTNEPDAPRITKRAEEMIKKKELIKANMAKMPAMIEEYRRERREAKLAKTPKQQAVPLVPEMPKDWLTQSVMQWPSLVVPTWPAAAASMTKVEPVIKDPLAELKAKAASTSWRARAAAAAGGAAGGAAGSAPAGGGGAGAAKPGAAGGTGGAAKTGAAAGGAGGKAAPGGGAGGAPAAKASAGAGAGAGAVAAAAAKGKADGGKSAGGAKKA